MTTANVTSAVQAGEANMGGLTVENITKGLPPVSDKTRYNRIYFDEHDNRKNTLRVTARNIYEPVQLTKADPVLTLSLPDKLQVGAVTWDKGTVEKDPTDNTGRQLILKPSSDLPFDSSHHIELDLEEVVASQSIEQERFKLFVSFEDAEAHLDWNDPLDSGPLFCGPFPSEDDVDLDIRVEIAREYPSTVSPKNQGNHTLHLLIVKSHQLKTRYPGDLTKNNLEVSFGVGPGAGDLVTSITGQTPTLIPDADGSHWSSSPFKVQGNTAGTNGSSNIAVASCRPADALADPTFMNGDFELVLDQVEANGKKGYANILFAFKNLQDSEGTVYRDAVYVVPVYKSHPRVREFTAELLPSEPGDKDLTFNIKWDVDGDKTIDKVTLGDNPDERILKSKLQVKWPADPARNILELHGVIQGQNAFLLASLDLSAKIKRFEIDPPVIDPCLVRDKKIKARLSWETEYCLGALIDAGRGPAESVALSGITEKEFSPWHKWTLKTVGGLGTASSTTTCRLSPPWDFQVGIGYDVVTALKGQRSLCYMTLTTFEGFTGVISFEVTGLPRGATGTFNMPSRTGSGGVKLWIDMDDTTLPGQYPLKITAVSADVQRTLTVQMKV